MQQFQNMYANQASLPQHVLSSGQVGQTVNSGSASGLTGRPPVIMYTTCDDDSLSPYQCLVRKQIEIFEARPEDVDTNAQGRNKPIVLGQVGIRCRHCAGTMARHRARAAVYFPAKLHGLYQAAQNMATIHLAKSCKVLPESIRAELQNLRERKSSAGGGKAYWGNGARILGVIEQDEGHGVLRFHTRIPHIPTSGSGMLTPKV